MTDDNPEIIIDEDWKSQVEKEQQQVADQPPESIEENTQETAPLEDDPNFTLFDSLTSGLAAQTMVALGLSGEEGEQVQVDLGYAHHLINTLVMLREKTATNLEEGEAANLDEAIGELTRVFSIREDQIGELENEPQPGAAPDLRILDKE